MKQYWEIAKKYRSSMLLSPVLVLVSVMCETVQPLFMAQIIDEGIMPSDLSVVSHVGVQMLLVSLVGLGVSMLNAFISSRASVGFGTDLRSSLFSKIQELSFADIDRFNTSSLITRLTGDIARIQQIVLMMMRMFLRAPMMMVMSIFFVFSINSRLALVLVVAAPVLGLIVFLILKKGFPIFMKVQQRIDHLNEIVRENLINIRVVKSFVREDFETQKFERGSEELRDTAIRASNTIVSIFPAMQLVMNLSVIAILWIGGGMVRDGELKVGELISFVNYLFQVLMSLMMFSMIAMNFARASASSKRIVEVLNANPSLKDRAVAKGEESKIGKGMIEFDHVSFHYAGGETDVLKNLTFTVQPGETIAVVGGTGAGKSSLVQLVPRLYDVTAGAVRIDGVDVRNYRLEDIHDKVGMVLQKNELFSGTIAENLRWGKQDATQEEMETATRVSEIHEFIISMPEGYDTLLGRGGVNLSGGQKQRLCIARALLRKPHILILDDSTSAVDTETELRIRTNLEKLLGKTTLLIITQRIHTMQAADRVLVLDDGEIAALGTPDALLSESEVYQEIYNSQQLHF